jgi:hypothetical protein
LRFTPWSEALTTGMVAASGRCIRYLITTLPAITAELPTLRSVGRCNRATIITSWRTSRLLEGAAIATVGGRPAVIATRRTITAVTTVVGSGSLLVLGPLGSEAEALELGQIEFIKIRRRIFLGGVVVHVVKAGW